VLFVHRKHFFLLDVVMKMILDAWMALGEGSKVWLSMVGNEHFIEESLGGVKY
jgi:hypothetical protein